MSVWLSLVAAAGLAFASQQQPGRDWGETLRADATAMHDAIASSHPGMVNPGDPDFARVNATQYALALERADRADNAAAWFYAMQHYVAAFDDGHMSFGVFGSTPDNQVKWPGFLVRDDGNRGLIVTVAEPWSGVSAGARIVECDGRDAFQIGDDRIGGRFGRWALSSQRAMFGPMVMIETGDPYVRPIRRCVFDTNGDRRSVDLDWREGGRDFYDRYGVFPTPERRAVGMRRLDDGTWWITLPTFDGNPESDNGRALRGLVSQVADQADAMRQAPAVVFDLRGNGGGSSLWSVEIARALWGEDALNHAPEPPMTLVWRASGANLHSLRETFAQRDANGNLSTESRAWFGATIAGLEAAIARGDDRWVIAPDVDGGPGSPDETPASAPPTGAVFALTDEACMSACLDAVDLWTRLGATPIGRETGADTVYMETRDVEMPSRLGRMSLPMKFYVGRARGHNQPVMPAHRFDGDMDDTALVEAWVETLPR